MRDKLGRVRLWNNGHESWQWHQIKCTLRSQRQPTSFSPVRYFETRYSSIHSETPKPAWIVPPRPPITDSHNTTIRTSGVGANSHIDQLRERKLFVRKQSSFGISCVCGTRTVNYHWCSIAVSRVNCQSCTLRSLPIGRCSEAAIIVIADVRKRWCLSVDSR